ncbi:MAG: hypothetical protein WEA77_10540, partial [Hyphomonas sp.]|uniref:hypothetical protein n=1 Tax=Hyphomonas sp. TaxID=87 RepID=UPI0034A0845C
MCHDIFAGGGGGALAAHARYVARDAARAEELDLPTPERSFGAAREAAEDAARAHADYLARGKQQRHPFYDHEGDGTDCGARAAEWAKS